jgi:transposase
MVQQQNWPLYSINNLKLARFKEIFPAASKSDRVDANRALQLFQLRDQVPLARGVLQEVVPSSEENAQLKRYTRRRKQIIDEKVRVSCRLQSDLQAVCPGLLEMTGQVGNKWFLQLLSSGDRLCKLRRLQRKTLLAIPSLGPKYADKIQAWQKDAIFSVEEPYVGEMIIEDARRLLQLREIERELKNRCEALNQRSSMAQHITSIPGFGVICAAALAGEIGSITRFTSEASLAVYIGMANLDRCSGKKQGAKAPKHVNSHAKSAMMVGVDRHRKSVPESQRYYEKKRAEGKSHNQAIRSLGRHLSRVIFNMLKHDRDYELRTKS